MHLSVSRVHRLLAQIYRPWSDSFHTNEVKPPDNRTRLGDSLPLTPHLRCTRCRTHHSPPLPTPIDPPPVQQQTTSRQLPDSNQKTTRQPHRPVGHLTAPAMHAVTDTRSTKSAAPVQPTVPFQGQPTTRQPPANRQATHDLRSSIRQLPNHFQTTTVQPHPSIAQPPTDRTAASMPTVTDTPPTQSAAPVLSNFRAQCHATTRIPPDHRQTTHDIRSGSRQLQATSRQLPDRLTNPEPSRPPHRIRDGIGQRHTADKVRRTNHIQCPCPGPDNCQTTARQSMTSDPAADNSQTTSRQLPDNRTPPEPSRPPHRTRDGNCHRHTADTVRRTSPINFPCPGPGNYQTTARPPPDNR